MGSISIRLCGISWRSLRCFCMKDVCLILLGFATIVPSFCLMWVCADLFSKRTTIVSTAFAATTGQRLELLLHQYDS